MPSCGLWKFGLGQSPRAAGCPRRRGAGDCELVFALASHHVESQGIVASKKVPEQSRLQIVVTQVANGGFGVPSPTVDVRANPIAASDRQRRSGDTGARCHKSPGSRIDVFKPPLEPAPADVHPNAPALLFHVDALFRFEQNAALKSLELSAESCLFRYTNSAGLGRGASVPTRPETGSPGTKARPGTRNCESREGNSGNHNVHSKSSSMKQMHIPGRVHGGSLP
jgi:hypothetical protein